MLNASYQLYRHAGTNDSTIPRTVGYALPAVLHTHVQTVVPTTYFGSMRTLRQPTRRPSVGAAVAREPVTVMSGRDASGLVVTPGILRWLYRTFAYVPAATGRNALGIGGYMKEYSSPTDLTTFMTIFRIDAATFTILFASGDNRIGVGDCKVKDGSGRVQFIPKFPASCN